MDARQYDRIADLLMQIRNKYADLLPNQEQNKQKKNDMLDLINAALLLNDEMGQDDIRGWL